MVAVLGCGTGPPGHDKSTREADWQENSTGTNTLRLSPTPQALAGTGCMISGCKLCWCCNIPFPACVLFSPLAKDDEARYRCILVWCCLLLVLGVQRGDGGSLVFEEWSGTFCECVLMYKKMRAVQCYMSCCNKVTSEQS